MGGDVFDCGSLFLDFYVDGIDLLGDTLESYTQLQVFLVIK